MLGLFKRERISTIDLQIVDGKRTLYYLHWFEGIGFIKFSKETYEREFVNSEEKEK